MRTCDSIGCRQPADRNSRHARISESEAREGTETGREEAETGREDGESTEDTSRRDSQRAEASARARNSYPRHPPYSPLPALPALLEVSEAVGPRFARHGSRGGAQTNGWWDRAPFVCVPPLDPCAGPQGRLPP